MKEKRNRTVDNCPEGDADEVWFPEGRRRLEASSAGQQAELLAFGAGGRGPRLSSSPSVSGARGANMKLLAVAMVTRETKRCGAPEAREQREEEEEAKPAFETSFISSSV